MPRAAPWVGNLYRPNRSDGSSPRPAGRRAWIPTRYDVDADVQLAEGRLEQAEQGRRAAERFTGFLDSGTDVRVGDGLELAKRRLDNGELVALPEPLLYEVTAAFDWGSRGGVQIELRRSTEQFNP